MQHNLMVNLVLEAEVNYTIKKGTKLGMIMEQILLNYSGV